MKAAVEISEAIERELLSWPDVTVGEHRFGGRAFRVGKIEIGHLHGGRVADLPFPRATRDELISRGEVSPHHHIPDSGWVSASTSKAKGTFRQRSRCSVAITNAFAPLPNGYHPRKKAVERSAIVKQNALEGRGGSQLAGRDTLPVAKCPVKRIRIFKAERAGGFFQREGRLAQILLGQFALSAGRGTCQDPACAQCDEKCRQRRNHWPESERE